MQVEQFSHINTIKKQYKTLALTLHPDKNPFSACEEAFKLVGEAMRVLTDKIRRKEYDMKLRIAMQSKAAEEADLGGEVAVETFWTICKDCQLLHKFERRYLGRRLMCPMCKKSFKAVEVDGGDSEGDVGCGERNEGFGEGQTRVSSRIPERVAKDGNSGNGDEGLLKDLYLKRVKKDVKSGVGDGKLKKVRKLVDVDESSGDGGVTNELEKKRPGGKASDGVEDKKSGGVEREGMESEKAGEEETMTLAQWRKKVKGEVERENLEREREKRTKFREEEVMTLSPLQKKSRNVVEKEGKSDGVETEESGRAKRAKGREEETLALSQLKTYARRKKVDAGKLAVDKKEVNAEKLKGNEGEKEERKDKEEEEKREEKEKEESGGERENEEMEKEVVNVREKRNRRAVSKYNDFVVMRRASWSPVNTFTECRKAPKKRNLAVLMGEEEKEKETENKKESEKETERVRGKRERRRVSESDDVEIVKNITSENHVEPEIERLIAAKKDSLEIMPVEDSDFHDFYKDRSERSFKKGQVWAVYDDEDGMPRHYALIDEIGSVNTFEVTLSWLQFESNGDEELKNWQKMGFHVSCGKFKVCRKISVKYLNLFSHVVHCERAAKEVYRIYPSKGSVWALYNDNGSSTEGRNGRVEEDKRYFDIVVSLSRFTDAYGVSVAYLEKVDGFRTVFKRREIGANVVFWFGKNDVKRSSH